ncbi:MAG: Intracellular exo-alpha-(1-_5)-L-arabinofuranosidase [Chloroflexi bacterium ADurb.Bin360]|nr:MAG: Intracellular exo-alpha-(1->5)-L-arabinofuranosidase [Chloroflexi bacterium ADurb.Bin360]
MVEPTPTAQVYLDSQRVIGEISPYLFGGFAEHMGRCIYEGIFDPASPHADEQGFRRDVLAALAELDFSIIRYPGGNFLSGYHWRDGVGPREQRPRRRELAWQSIETNQFGVNEFMDFCRRMGTAPMLGVNLGTGTIEEAAALVEYCNAPVGTAMADLRAAHGYREPHGVRHWCLGNEMDGPWQIGGLDAEAYALKAREAAKMMKWQDSSIKLTLCGSSGMDMPTFPEWDRVALEHCWEQVDYLSLHTYVGNRDDDTGSYLALPHRLEEQVDTLAATLRYVKARLRSRHEVHLSWDEWNVWYKDMTMQGGWTEAPHLIEEVYNLEDALVVAQWLNLFLRRCDVLHIACLAQIVNVIAPILTTRESLLRQSTFYPFQLFRRAARGLALDAHVEAPHYATQRFGAVPLLDVSASYDPGTGTGAVFLVNRSQEQPLPVELLWQRQAPQRITEAVRLAGADPKAANTFERPTGVAPTAITAPSIVDGAAQLLLPPLSLTVVLTADA